MSAVEKNKESWSMGRQNLDPRYEKCRNITEEIYKRINITFEIKKLESACQSDISDHSDLIDSNELSNETDLFACDKSDSISSSTGAEKGLTCHKYININNNEEMNTKKPVVVYKRPRKRFRKRVKKRPTPRARSSEGSSDEALPLSRIVEIDCKSVDNDDNVMGVPNIVIITRDLKPKIQSDKAPKKIYEIKQKTETENDSSLSVRQSGAEWQSCVICSQTFRGGRGLSYSHFVEIKWSPIDTCTYSPRPLPAVRVPPDLRNIFVSINCLASCVRRHMTMFHSQNHEESTNSVEQRGSTLNG